MTKILLLDPNFSADPISDFLLKMGHSVLRVGKSDKNARKRENEQFINQDFSNIDKLIELIKSEYIKQIIPGCTDKSFKIANTVGKLFGFEGYGIERNVEHLLNKKSLARFLQEHGLPHPKTFSEITREELDSTKKINWIMKPEIGFSGNEVTPLNLSDKSLDHSLICEMINQKSIILQEFVEGQLYSFSGILSNYQVINHFIVREECLNNKWRVNLSYVEFNFNEQSEKDLIEMVSKIARVSRKPKGLIHVQFILTSEGPKIIEIIERMPGDLYSNLIRLSGYEYYVTGYLLPYLANFNLEDLSVKNKIPIVRSTTRLHLINEYFRKNPDSIFKVLEIYDVNRSTNSNLAMTDEVVAFFSLESEILFEKSILTNIFRFIAED
jgi:predicted ATP-grasp superfamily ATP-dependent carboligase